MVNSKPLIELRLTQDGSSTLYVPSMDETYHSVHGAIQEANHVFIKNGIDMVDSEVCHVLEVGFGTGLNSMLTLKYAEANKKRIFYQGLESFPVDYEMIAKLNYSSQVSDLDPSFFKRIHTSEWEKEIEVSPYFSLLKTKTTVQNFSAEEKFDVVYYDAFGPRAQSEMWDKSIFENLYSVLKSGGLLVTYCAMGQFKRDLKSSGFEVHSVPGPPGKREMTIAKKL